MSTSRWGIAFSGSAVLLRESNDRAQLPSRADLLVELGSERLDSAAVPAIVVGADGGTGDPFDLGEGFVAPAGYRLEGLRSAFHNMSEKEFGAACTARQKVEWYRTHGFCSRCGADTVRHELHEAMACPVCGQLHFPRVAPAIIVLIQRRHEVLLGRSPHFAEGVYSTLAGFVEPGESLEQCVHREIAEEVGVQVTNLRYFGSQSHPFPNSLMIGFLADWLSGDIRIDPLEIEDARWFTRQNLPVRPHRMSIARALIEDFVRRDSV